MKYKTTILIVVLVSLCSVLGQSVFALSCAEPSIERDMAVYPVAFVGEVTAVESYQNMDSQYEGIIHFDVSEVFKGDVTEQYMIYGSLWGPEFVVGETYFLFANVGELGPAYADCSSTTKLSNLDILLKELGNSYRPMPGQSGVYGEGTNKVRLAALAIVGASAGGVWFMRGRNKLTKEAKFNRKNNVP